MSGLEVVASIAGVAAAAIKVSVCMNDLAENLGSAGRDVLYIANDMAGFSQVLRLVHSSLEESIKVAGSKVIQSVLDTLPQLVDQCGMVYDEANKLMAALSPTAGKESMSFLKKVRFIFYKGRITILRSLLDSSKSTLNLLLVTLNIEMARNRSPDKALMDQLQNERKAFIRVVYSQNQALDEAMKEVEKAKKEAAKFKSKRDKEKEKVEKKHEEPTFEGPPTSPPERMSTPYSYKPPPPYSLHSAPSVSQLVYQPPSLERFNSVKNSSQAVTTLALSLEPATPTGPTPATSHPGKESNGTYNSYASYASPPPPAQPCNEPWNTSEPVNTSAREAESEKPRETSHNGRPAAGNSGQRVFSDPGPGIPRQTSSEHLNPGAAPRERARSPYGFSRVPQDDTPKVERKRSSFPSQPQSIPQNNASKYRTFSTPGPGSSKMGSVPEEPELTPKAPRNSTSSQTTEGKKPWSNFPGPPPPPPPEEPPTTEQRKPSFTYQPPPPPPPPAYTGTEDGSTQHKSSSSQTPSPPKPPKVSAEPSVPPSPLPRHGTTYIVLTPYITHEIGHLSLVPFDTLVDVTSYTPEEDSPPKHYWQASLGNRRGPRGLFPHDVVCSVDDERVTKELSKNWFAEKKVGFISDAAGRCWVGPG